MCDDGDTYAVEQGGKSCFSFPLKRVSALLRRTSHQLLSHFPETQSDRLIVGAAGRFFLLTLRKVFASYPFHLGRSRQVERGLSALLNREQERLEQLHSPGGRADHPRRKITGSDTRMQRVHGDPCSLKSTSQFIRRKGRASFA